MRYRRAERWQSVDDICFVCRRHLLEGFAIHSFARPDVPVKLLEKSSTVKRCGMSAPGGPGTWDVRTQRLPMRRFRDRPLVRSPTIIILPVQAELGALAANRSSPGED